MTTLKSIVIESLARANLVPRKRAAPADMIEDGFRLLKGIIQAYNFENFISFARTSITVSPLHTEYYNIADDFGNQTFSSISNVSYELRHGYNEALTFKSRDQFVSTDDMYTYTWFYTINGDIIVQFKPDFVKLNKTVWIFANENLNYTLDDEINVPQIYEELFTQALTYKLAVAKPRMDASQIQILKNDLTALEGQVKSLISSNKILTRERKCANFDDIMSGGFIFR